MFSRIPAHFKKLFFILLLFLISLYVSLPSQIPLNFSWGNFSFNRTINRPDLNLNISGKEIHKSFDLVLGLDLAGGSHLVFEADLGQTEESKRKDALEGVKGVIERRVNLFGISEPVVQTSTFQGKDRIIVELPGVKDTKEAIDLIGRTAQLTFAEVETSSESGEMIKPTQLTGAYLKSADVRFDQTTGQPVVGIEFSKEGGEIFAELTKNNIGKPLAIILDTSLVSAPTVNEVIPDGSAVISGGFSLEDARTLAIQLNAGALPVPVRVVEERVVGATLGAESVQRSVKAGLVGLTMVLVFMILAYGRLGIIANLALVVFGVITLALYKLIPIVLTLPGIAGFLLSVGMAVDSNILIFERFKEERKKRPLADALEVSFGRAWDSIRDANIATLVTAFILANPFDWSFLHTSGPVRGFAITLALGIGISLFTGVVVSRNLLRVFIRESKIVKKGKERHD